MSEEQKVIDKGLGETELEWVIKSREMGEDRKDWAIENWSKGGRSYHVIDWSEREGGLVERPWRWYGEKMLQLVLKCADNVAIEMSEFSIKVGEKPWAVRDLIWDEEDVIDFFKELRKYRIEGNWDWYRGIVEWYSSLMEESVWFQGIKLGVFFSLTRRDIWLETEQHSSFIEKLQECACEKKLGVYWQNVLKHPMSLALIMNKLGMSGEEIEDEKGFWHMCYTNEWVFGRDENGDLHGFTLDEFRREHLKGAVREGDAIVIKQKDGRSFWRTKYNVLKNANCLLNDSGQKSNLNYLNFA